MDLAEASKMAQQLRPALRAFFLDAQTVKEDVWTPTYFGGSTAGVTTYAANGQLGRYVRFGPLVIVWGRVIWTAATGTGGANIGGLPYAAANFTNIIFPVTVWVNGLTYTQAPIIPRLNANGSTAFQLEFGTNNGGPSPIGIEAAGDIAFCLPYLMG